MNELTEKASKLYQEYKDNAGSPWFNERSFRQRVRKLASTIDRTQDGMHDAILYLDVISIRSGIDLAYAR